VTPSRSIVPALVFSKLRQDLDMQHEQSLIGKPASYRLSESHELSDLAALQELVEKLQRATKEKSMFLASMRYRQNM
jgi:hypothetical protein